MRNRFILTSEEAELLLEFESAGSLQQLSEVIFRDPSQVSRMIQKIQSKLPVVEKVARRWQLTELGRSYNEATRNYLMAQVAKSNELHYLKIGTNREFAGRVLSLDFAQFAKLFSQTQIRLNSYESGVEKQIMSGEIDIGIDCERPQFPDVSYKTAFVQNVIPVASSKFHKLHLKSITQSEMNFLSLPHLLCDRLYPHLLFKTAENQIAVHAAFNDINSARTVAVNGMGWALLPEYAVRNELLNGDLVKISNVSYSTSYGVWWLRSRTAMRPQVDLIVNYLKKKFYKLHS